VPLLSTGRMNGYESRRGRGSRTSRGPKDLGRERGMIFKANFEKIAVEKANAPLLKRIGRKLLSERGGGGKWSYSTLEPACFLGVGEKEKNLLNSSCSKRIRGGFSDGKEGKVTTLFQFQK